MFGNLTEITNNLVALEINAHQFYILQLIDTRDIENLKKYIKTFGKFDTDDFKVLLDKNYIINVNEKAKTLDLNNLVVTLDYKELAILPAEDAFEQLLEVYPKHVIVNNTKYPSTGLNIQDFKEVERIYLKQISKSKLLHTEILRLIGKWKDDVGENAPFKIDKFVVGSYWDALKEAEKNGTKIRIY